MPRMSCAMHGVHRNASATLQNGYLRLILADAAELVELLQSSGTPHGRMGAAQQPFRPHSLALYPSLILLFCSLHRCASATF